MFQKIKRAISEQPTFASAIEDNPLELLEKIKKLMHTLERAKYPSLTMMEILNNFLRIKQQDKEELVDYLSRFKFERNVL